MRCCISTFLVFLLRISSVSYPFKGSWERRRLDVRPCGDKVLLRRSSARYRNRESLSSLLFPILSSFSRWMLMRNVTVRILVTSGMDQTCRRRNSQYD